MTKGFQALKDIGECLLLEGVLDDINQERIGFIAKELQALEIIKDKKVNVSALLELDDLQQYNDYCNMVGGCEKLGYEYDLLKEVLL